MPMSAPLDAMLAAVAGPAATISEYCTRATPADSRVSPAHCRLASERPRYVTKKMAVKSVLLWDHSWYLPY